MSTQAISIAYYSMSVVVMLLLFACVSTNGVYLHERRELYREGTSETSDRPTSRGDSRQQQIDNSDETDISTSSRREPFQRILVLCNHDNECERKSFCHGGEGHKSCLPCRRSRRRCQRNGMCCHGNVCRQGRCVPKEMRYDTSYAKSSSSDLDEESISQHTKDNMRKLREDEACETTEQCGNGLCCAQHFWTRICKPILVEGDVCTKKRDRHTDFFQRCHCGGSLSCKRHPALEIRYHTCQFIKGGRRFTIEDDEDRNEEEVVVNLIKEKEEPTLHIEVQLTTDQIQHELNDQAGETDSRGTDREILVDYGSEDQFVSENRLRDNRGDEEEEQRLDDTTNQQSSTGLSRIPADSSQHLVTQIIATL